MLPDRTCWTRLGDLDEPFLARLASEVHAVETGATALFDGATRQVRRAVDVPAFAVVDVTLGTHVRRR